MCDAWAELLSEDTGSVWRVTRGCRAGRAAGKRVAWESGGQIVFPGEGALNYQQCVSLSLKDSGLRLQQEGPTERAQSLPERKAVQKGSLVGLPWWCRG